MVLQLLYVCRRIAYDQAYDLNIPSLCIIKIEIYIKIIAIFNTYCRVYLNFVYRCQYRKTYLKFLHISRNISYHNTIITMIYVLLYPVEVIAKNMDHITVNDKTTLRLIKYFRSCQINKKPFNTKTTGSSLITKIHIKRV